jgi:hypothetical protein
MNRAGRSIVLQGTSSGLCSVIRHYQQNEIGLSFGPFDLFSDCSDEFSSGIEVQARYASQLFFQFAMLP